MNCDLCGSKEELYKCIVEGTEMKVCKACSSFGKVIEKIKEPSPKEEKHAAKKIAQQSAQPPARPEITQIIIPNYSTLIKEKREKLGMKQEELAKILNEKESLISQIESGHFRPNVDLARKFERYLKIRLVEEFEETESSSKKGKGSDSRLTIGDLIELK